MNCDIDIFELSGKTHERQFSYPWNFSIAFIFYRNLCIWPVQFEKAFNPKKELLFRWVCLNLAPIWTGGCDPICGSRTVGQWPSHGAGCICELSQQINKIMVIQFECRSRLVVFRCRSTLLYRKKGCLWLWVRLWLRDRPQRSRLGFCEDFIVKNRIEKSLYYR